MPFAGDIDPSRVDAILREISRSLSDTPRFLKSVSRILYHAGFVGSLLFIEVHAVCGSKRSQSVRCLVSIVATARRLSRRPLALTRASYLPFSPLGYGPQVFVAHFRRFRFRANTTLLHVPSQKQILH